jgi:4-diphosphocytidyl-2-C-methyl-D-erythritol kinase
VPDSLTESASAKVNLYLHLTGQRADGYHLLDSLVVFVRAGDELTAQPATTLSLSVEGPFATALAGVTDNLVLRAARVLAAALDVMPQARLVLHKNLPVASGIGGGSADAAAALRLLCRMWRATTDDATMLRLAGVLGADVPVCLAGRPSRMGGVGEQLRPAPLMPACGMALINPGVPVATVDVFRAWRGAWSSPADLPFSWPDLGTMVGDLERLRNDLEPTARALEPTIGQVLWALANEPGCRLARMSGAGATCFGLFDDPKAAGRAARRLRRPGWWCWGGALRRGRADFTLLGARPIHASPDGA